ncbi:MAG: hypothetical protein GYB65_17680 [Chloroflexi bacterium]|nr:hypothetical protein [Chloroflexota bacterium]
MSNPQIEQLLKDGIQAARANDKATARSYLEQVVELDQHNEKGWFWLAAVVETDEEKRVCLGNVVVINPNNQRAQRLLDQLDRKQATSSSGGVIGEGMDRNTLYLAIGLGIAAVAVLIIVVIVALGSGGGDDNGSAASGNTGAVGQGDSAGSDADAPDDTNSAEDPDTDENGEDSSENGADPDAPDGTTPDENNGDADGTSGQDQEPNGLPDGGAETGAQTTLTPEDAIPTPLPSPVPPTPTPIPTVTEPLTGRIIVQYGDEVAFNNDRRFQFVGTIDPDGTELLQLIQDRFKLGHLPVLSPNGENYGYTLYDYSLQDTFLTLSNLYGTEQTSAARLWPGSILDNSDMLAWSPDGRYLAFTAHISGFDTTQLFLLEINDSLERVDRTDNPLQLTDDTRGVYTESWPAFSPDSSQLVYVATNEQTGQTELFLYDIDVRNTTPNAGRQQLTENGNEFIEAAPDWSPDGEYIIFQAQQAGADDMDIFRLPVDTRGATPEPILDYEWNDIQPRYSPENPDWIVFSSDRLDEAGNWDVFLYNIATDEVFQVLVDENRNLANDWSR